MEVPAKVYLFIELKHALLSDKGGEMVMVLRLEQELEEGHVGFLFRPFIPGFQSTDDIGVNADRLHTLSTIGYVTLKFLPHF
jgi:hypothetical protein